MDYSWEAFDVKSTNDNGFILSGNKSWIWSGDGKEQGLWVIKTDEMGKFYK